MHMLPSVYPNNNPTIAPVSRVMLFAALGMAAFSFVFFGCSKKAETGNTADSTALAMPPPPPPAATAAPITDANILAALDEGDSAEIALGKLALVKSKNGEVKGFAKMMIADHGKMKKDKEALAKKLNITPQPPANDPEPAHLTGEMGALNDAPTPIAFDSTYIDDAVADHTHVLAAVKDFETKATAPELKNALTKAEPTVQKHLDRAKAIQAGRAK